MNRNECSLQVLIGTIYFTFAIFAWLEGSEGWQIFSNKRKKKKCYGSTCMTIEKTMALSFADPGFILASGDGHRIA